MTLAAPVVSPVTLSPTMVSQITLVRSSAPSSPRLERSAAAVTELPTDRDGERSGAGTPPELARERGGSKRGEVYV